MNVKKYDNATTIHKGLVTHTHDQCITPNNFNTIKSMVISEPIEVLALIQPLPSTSFLSCIF